MTIFNETMYAEIFKDLSSSLVELGASHGGRDFTGKWEDKHWMNTPGPIYAGLTGNSGNGFACAPNNICVDKEGRELVFRQPVNLFELKQVIQAARTDSFAGYAADGDLNWSYASIKSWWSGRKHLQAEVAKLIKAAEINQQYLAAFRRWHDFLQDGLHQYLRVYAFYLEQGYPPERRDVLPML